MNLDEWKIVKANIYKGNYLKCDICRCVAEILVITLQDNKDNTVCACSSCSRMYSDASKKISDLEDLSRKAFNNRSNHLVTLHWSRKDLLDAKKIVQQVMYGHEDTWQYINNFTIYNVWHKSQYNRWLVYVNFSNGNKLKFGQEYKESEDAQLAVYDFAMQNEINKIVKYNKNK